MSKIVALQNLNRYHLELTRYIEVWLTVRHNSYQATSRKFNSNAEDCGETSLLCCRVRGGIEIKLGIKMKAKPTRRVPRLPSGDRGVFLCTCLADAV